VILLEGFWVLSNDILGYHHSEQGMRRNRITHRKPCEISPIVEMTFNTVFRTKRETENAFLFVNEVLYKLSRDGKCGCFCAKNY
jgi:hypothetical protein